MDLFELPDKKNIRKLISKYELFFLNQASSSSDQSQILIPQHPIPIYLPCVHDHLCLIFPEKTETSSTIVIMLFFGFLSPPALFNHASEVLDI